MYPKGHWDVKDGPDGPWQNYTPDGELIPKGSIWGENWEPILENPNVRMLPEVVVEIERTPQSGTPKKKETSEKKGNFIQQIWQSIKEWYKNDLRKRQYEEVPDYYKA